MRCHPLPRLLIPVLTLALALTLTHLWQIDSDESDYAMFDPSPFSFRM